MLQSHFILFIMSDSEHNCPMKHKCMGCLELLQEEGSPAKEEDFYQCYGCYSKFCDDCSSVVYETNIVHNCRFSHRRRYCFGCQLKYEPFIHYLLGRANFASMEEAWTTFAKGNSTDLTSRKRKVEVPPPTEQSTVDEEC